MKKLFFIKTQALRGVLSLVALLACIGMNAKVVTFDSTNSPWTGTAGVQSGTVDGITLECGNGLYSSTGEYRFYKGQTCTITSTVGNITSVVFTCTANGTTKYGPGCFATPAVGEYTFEADGATGTWTGSSATVTLTASTNQVRATTIVVTVEDNPDAVASPVIKPASGTYYEAQTVTMTASEGCTIKYSINQGAEQTYSAPFELSEAGTYNISAYAVNAEGKNSETVSSVITIATLPEYASLKDAFAAATSTSAPCKFTFNNVVVTAASSSNAFLQDADGNYAVIYQSGHGFTQGQTISGTINTNIVLYRGILEFTGITSTTEGLTLGTGTPVAEEMSLEDLGPAHYGKLIVIKNATYSDGKFSQTTDDTYYVTPYTSFMTLPTFLDGKNYNITGIAMYYTSGDVTTLEISPRSEEDIVLLTDQKVQTLSANYKTSLQVGKEDAYTIEQEGDGEIKASSSDDNIATVTLEGNNVTVKAIAKGTATITLTAGETSTYLPAELSYTVTVSNAGEYEATWIAKEQADYANAASIDTLSGYTVDNITLTFSQGTNTSNNPKYYTTGEGARLYFGNTMTVSAANGYIIKEIDITFSGSSYTGSYAVEDNLYTEDGATGCWKANEASNTQSVVFTANATSRMQKVVVTYVNGSASVKGDVNGDNTVDIADVNAIISVICGGDKNDKADVNSDQTVDIADVNAVIGIICGNN